MQSYMPEVAAVEFRFQYECSDVAPSIILNSKAECGLSLRCKTVVEPCCIKHAIKLRSIILVKGLK